MQVRMIAQITGTRDGVEWPRVGGVLSCDEVEAASLIASGLAAAVPATAAPVIETAAAAPAVETAAVKRGRPRKTVEE